MEKFDIYYNWSLITEDFDDNKFVDLAISSNSDYIVTNDKHFKVLEEIEFPNVKVISLDDFLEYYYLYPIPSNEILLTGGKVVQNPGWK